MSDFSSNTIRGTRHLADGIKRAYNDTDSPRVKSEINSILTLLPGQDGRSLSAKRITEKYGLSVETIDALQRGMKRNTFEYTFVFSAGEFQKFASFKTVELDTGAILTAPADRFDQVFDQETSDDGTVTVKATGRIEKSKLRKSH